MQQCIVIVSLSVAFSFSIYIRMNIGMNNDNYQKFLIDKQGNVCIILFNSTCHASAHYVYAYRDRSFFYEDDYGIKTGIDN